MADPFVDLYRICILRLFFVALSLAVRVSLAISSRSQFNTGIIFTEMNHYRIIKITKIDINYCNSAHIRHFHTRRCQPKYFIRVRSVTARCLPFRFMPFILCFFHFFTLVHLFCVTKSFIGFSVSLCYFAVDRCFFCIFFLWRVFLNLI